MEYEEVASSSVIPVKRECKKVEPDDVDQYHAGIWSDLGDEFIRNYKRGKLVSKSQAGKSSSPSKVIRGAFSLYLDDLKSKVVETESETLKTLQTSQLKSLERSFENILEVIDALGLDVDRKSLTSSLQGYINETASRIKL